MLLLGSVAAKEARLNTCFGALPPAAIAAAAAAAAAAVAAATAALGDLRHFLSSSCLLNKREKKQTTHLCLSSTLLFGGPSGPVESAGPPAAAAAAATGGPPSRLLRLVLFLYSYKSSVRTLHRRRQLQQQHGEPQEAFRRYHLQLLRCSYGGPPRWGSCGSGIQHGRRF